MGSGLKLWLCLTVAVTQMQMYICNPDYTVASTCVTVGTIIDIMADLCSSDCPLGKLNSNMTAVIGKFPQGLFSSGMSITCICQITYTIHTASETNVIMNECRCVPSLPADLAEDLVTGARFITKAETQVSSLANSLGSNQQRLRRYISDINRGRWIIIAAGKRVALE